MTTASAPPPETPSSRIVWTVLLTLLGGFALSQAYRTVAGILSVPLIAQFGLSAREMGAVAAAFHFAFGALQLLMGIGIDVFGIRRTILLAFPLTVLGSALSALAPSPGVLIAGQALIGIGCAPAFLVCTVFIARHFPRHRFAALSGMAMGVGGLGLIFTGTPLAWLVERLGWRAGFWVLCALSLAAWVAMYCRVFEPARGPARAAPAESLWDSIKGYGTLLRMPHTAGILALVFVGYASFITLRGLWLAPYLGDRFGSSLVFSGHVALALSLFSMVSLSFVGRLDPGDGKRRYWLVRMPWTLVAMFLVLAFTSHLALAVACILSVAVFGSVSVWQYADVRAAYPSHMTGRALALYTMSMFLGVAVMQSVTGIAADWAIAHGWDKYRVVYGSVAAMLAAGILAYALLPHSGAAGTRNVD